VVFFARFIASYLESIGRLERFVSQWQPGRAAGDTSLSLWGSADAAGGPMTFLSPAFYTTPFLKYIS